MSGLLVLFTALIKLADVVASFFTVEQQKQAGVTATKLENLQKVLKANEKADDISHRVESGGLSDPFRDQPG